MKSWFACAVVLAMLLGCKKKNDPAEIVPAEPELKKEDVMPNLGKSIYLIDEWYGVSGTDTTYLKDDPFYGEIMKKVFLTLRDGRKIYYYMGFEFPNTVFLGNARTFNVNMFYLRSLDLNYAWDEKENNLLLPWENRGDDLPIIPKGITMRLDKSAYKQLTTFEEAKVSRKSGSMRFQYEYQDKTYSLVLKQMWIYGETGARQQYYCVVF